MASGTTDEEAWRDIRRRRLEKALQQPVRTRLRAELESGTASLAEIADRLGWPLSWITYHYRVLETVGGLPSSRSEES